MLFQILHE